jgi:hypothetical protein
MGTPDSSYMGAMRVLGTRTQQQLRCQWKPALVCLRYSEYFVTSIFNINSYVVQEQRPNRSGTSMQVVGECIGGVLKVGTLLVRESIFLAQSKSISRPWRAELPSYLVKAGGFVSTVRSLAKKHFVFDGRSSSIIKESGCPSKYPSEPWILCWSWKRTELVSRFYRYAMPLPCSTLPNKRLGRFPSGVR